jgi:ABC-2 type transport system ATP-binding protein
MYRGRVIALGSPQSLKDGMREHHILELISSDLFGSMRALEEQPGIHDVAVFGGGLHVTVDDETAGPARITAALGGKGITIERLAPIEPTMEDVFVAMIESADREEDRKIA